MSRRIGPYRIVGELGRGGMGVVYRVEEEATGRELALKQIFAAAEREEVERFQREAELLARIRHPNVLRVHTVGSTAKGPYLVTELVDGEPLSALLRRGPVAPAEARRIVLALAQGLDALHRIGIVHRDVKPENVILCADGRPVLLDFGVALDPRNSRMTHSGTLLGTPSYMSPEQARGDVRAMDASTDVFALGALLYALLVGRPPFPGSSMLVVLDDVVHKEPEWAEDLPRGLVDVGRRAMAKSQSERYGTAGELAEVLAAVDLGEPAPGVRFRSRWLPVLASIPFLLVLGVGLLVYARGRPADSKGPERRLSSSARSTRPQPAAGRGEASRIQAFWEEEAGPGEGEIRYHPRSGFSFTSAPSLGEPRTRLLLFGGLSPAPNLSKNQAYSLTLDEFNGERWLVPHNVTATRTWLDKRYGHAACYDSQRRRLVVHGGYRWSDEKGREEMLGQLHSWSETWEGSSRDEERKLSRAHHGMIYHPARQTVMAFAGQGLSRQDCDDLFEWSASTDAWAKIECERRPSPRRNPRLAYMRGVVYLFGGEHEGALLNDLWTWTADQGWVEVPRSDPWPAPREGPGFVSDEDSLLLLVGGLEEESVTWVWQEGAWQRVPGAPPGRTGTQAVWDPTTRRFFLFGGERGGAQLAELWSCRVSAR